MAMLSMSICGFADYNYVNHWLLSRKLHMIILKIILLLFQIHWLLKFQGTTMSMGIVYHVLPFLLINTQHYNCSMHGKKLHNSKPAYYDFIQINNVGFTPYTITYPNFKNNKNNKIFTCSESEQPVDLFTGNSIEHIGPQHTFLSV